MKLKIHIVVTIFLFISTFVYSQKQIQNLNAVSFFIENNNEKIEFIKLNEDLNVPKPTIIFFQGSLPVPLIIDLNNGNRIITGVNNFDYNKIVDKFNLVLISQPDIPLIAKEDDLNHQFAYIINKKDEHSYPQAYLNDNYLEKHVERGNAVIKYLLHQKWVDKKHIIVVGHSQGAKIAAKIALENNHISTLGFLSGNPIGRVDQFIRQSRLSELKGVISPEKSQDEINKTYDWWKWVNEHANVPSQKGEDSPRTLISFSASVLPDLLKITIPIYIAYGTKDVVSSYCDLLPIDFIRAGKTNYQLVPYIGLDHNYFEVDSTGKPNYDKCHWEQVMNNFIDWVNRNCK